MQIAVTFKIVCGWMCARLALSGVISWYAACGLDLIISFAGILSFTGLTMYDAQKVKQMAVAEGETFSRKISEGMKSKG